MDIDDKILEFFNKHIDEHCDFCKYKADCHGITCRGGEPIEPPCAYQNATEYLDGDIINDWYKTYDNEGGDEMGVRHEFKIGDRVKTEFGNGTIVDSAIDRFLVKHDNWLNGHGNHYGMHESKLSYESDKSDCWYFNEDNLELIKPAITITNDSISFGDYCTISKEGIEFKNIEKEEEIDMNKVLEIYKERKITKIKNVIDEEIERRYNELEIVKKYNSVLADFEEQMQELYDIDENKNEKLIARRYSDNDYKFAINCGLKSSISNEVKEEYKKDIDELNNLISEVEAQLSMSDDLEYQRKILKDYGIIDKKTGKINA